MVHLARRLCVLLVCSTLGCGDAASMHGDDADSEVEPTRADPIEALVTALDAAWCEPYAWAFCEAALTCSCTSAKGWPAACLGAARESCRDTLRFRSAVSPGAVADARRIPECLRAAKDTFGRCAALPSDFFDVTCPIVAAPVPAELPGEGEVC